ncbi:MAG TPA: cation-transporting P-type ATPase [Micromonosporaceae bacterium]|nr:cation-transporting P-type ATPase [Micromonosporaceae bacterium]
MESVQARPADGRELTPGLTSAEAARRLTAEGRNETRPAAPIPVWSRIGRQIADPLIVLLLASATVTAIAGDVTDTSVIVLVVVVNTIIGVAQEVRAERAIAVLRQLGAPTSRVVRDGRDQVVTAAEIVRGDVVRLASGDIVPADIVIDDAHVLKVDESALTGESRPVGRSVGQDLSAGTVIAAGRATGTVVRTGPDSALGRIVALTEQARSGATPLQRRLARLGRVLATWTVALSAIVTAVGIIRGRPPLEMAIVGVSLVVAAVPESLPAVVTLALALGARRMAAEHALTRRLVAVETLGSVNVLVSDKTGTLTQGRMAVQQAATIDGGRYTISGDGYAPNGDVRTDVTGDQALLAAMSRAAVLCNDAELVAPKAGRTAWTVAGEQLEGALVAFAERTGVGAERTRAASPRVSETPFDQRSRMMTTEHAGPHKTHLVVCKGAPEAVLRHDVIDATDAEINRLIAVATEFASTGLRALAFAAGPVGELRPVGVVGVGDPVRDNAADVLRQLDEAGIRTVIVTGDHPGTARHVAEDVGIWRTGDVVVDCTADDWALADMSRVRIFARARPDHKLAIVESLKSRGATVAVTGDGVNDAPALRRADIGVAMGGGTEVAHQAARLVLADDDLATVSSAVGEGRRVYDNIRRFLRYALSGGVAELATMLVGPLVGLAIPILPAQILWINLLTHGLPGVAMGAEPGAPDAMRRPPRPADESVLAAGLGRAVLGTGLFIGALTLAVGVAAAALSLPWQSLAFLALGFGQLGVALAVRAPRRPGQDNPWLGAAVALSAALMLGGVYVPGLRHLLSTEWVTPLQLAVVLAVSTIPGLVIAVTHRLRPTPA